MPLPIVPAPITPMVWIIDVNDHDVYIKYDGVIRIEPMRYLH